MARILLVNKFYYFRGGDCTAVLTTEELLKKHGHEVAVFSMRYAENLPTSWEKYFPEEVSFSTAGIANKLKAFKRVFSDTEVIKKFHRLLSDFQPDVVHLHNIIPPLPCSPAPCNTSTNWAPTAMKSMRKPPWPASPTLATIN